MEAEVSDPSSEDDRSQRPHSGFKPKASRIPLGHEGSTSATTSIDQWVISTRTVHNAASVAAMQGRAVAAAANVRSVHTGAPSTEPAANRAASATSALLGTGRKSAAQRR